MVVSSGEWSAPISQLIIVAWCCSTRRICASGSCRALFMRAALCEKRCASSSMPFIRMMRTRVYASSSSLLIGFCTRSRQVNFCFASGTPRFSNRVGFMPAWCAHAGAISSRRAPRDSVGGTVTGEAVPARALLHRCMMGARVLIADDNPDALLTLEALLDSEGYDVRSVNKGSDVLPALREFHPHAVVLDIKMPGLSGY